MITNISHSISEILVLGQFSIFIYISISSVPYFSISREMSNSDGLFELASRPLKAIAQHSEKNKTKDAGAVWCLMHETDYEDKTAIQPDESLCEFTRVFFFFSFIARSRPRYMRACIVTATTNY